MRNNCVFTYLHCTAADCLHMFTSIYQGASSFFNLLPLIFFFQLKSMLAELLESSKCRTKFTLC